MSSGSEGCQRPACGAYVALAAVGLWTGAPAEGMAQVTVVPAVATLSTSAPLPSDGRLGGISVDADGNIYVANFSGAVWRVAPSGSVETVLADLRGSSGNTVLRDGSLLQASFMDNRIVRVVGGGEATVFADTGLDGPVGLVEDEEGRVYVCNCRGNSVSVIDPGRPARVLAQGGRLDCPNGITIGPDGSLYVVSYNNEHIVRISPHDGAMTTLASLPAGGNAHLAVLAGSLYVTRIAQGALYRVGMDGRTTQVLGGVGPGLRDGGLGVAQLAHPNGIAVGPGGRYLYVNDLDGPWKTEQPGVMLIRRIGPFPGSAGAP